MSKQQMSVINNPLSEHSIADRQAITADILKVSEHELQKEFSRRLEECRARRNQVWEESLRARDAYNAALVDFLKSTLKGINRQLDGVFSPLSSLYGKQPREEILCAVVVYIDTLLFEGSKDIQDTFSELLALKSGDTKVNLVLPGTDFRWTTKGVDELREMGAAITVRGVEDWLADPVNVEGRIRMGNDSAGYMSSSRQQFSLQPDSSLIEARRGLSTHAMHLFHAVKEVDKAAKELADLPDLIKELEIQSTAARVKDAGGEDLLRGILDAVDRIKGGDRSISGLRLALGDGGEDS